MRELTGLRYILVSEIAESQRGAIDGTSADGRAAFTVTVTIPSVEVAMPLFVVRCDDCWRVSLLPHTQFQNGVAACGECGRQVRVMPSSTYREEDAPDFQELSDTLREGKVRPLEALQLATQLRRALANESFEEFFELLSIKTPAFTPVQLLFGGRPSLQLRALRMLATILDALSAPRSGTMEAVADPTVGSNKRRA